MGLRAAFRGKRVYFDANIFIYLIEGFAALERQLLAIRDSIAAGEAEIVTSELTLSEVLVAPFRKGDAALAAVYREFLEDSGAFVLRPAARETWVRASLYRAQSRLKTPDALHIATAVEAECSLFLTHDKPLQSLKGLRIAQIAEL